MPRLRSAATGVWVNVPEGHAYTSGVAYLTEEQHAQSQSKYAGLTVAELKDELNQRNESREDKLATGGNKPELIARLEADDQAQSQDNADNSGEE